MTIFEQLIIGRLPAHWVHQDDRCVVFMDIHPMSPGHTLVVPRQAVATLAELDADTRAHLFEVAQRVALAQQRSLGSLAQHLLINDGKAASQSVPHVHIHVIPRYGNDTLHTVARMLWHVATLAVPKRVGAGRRKELQTLAGRIARGLQAQAAGRS